MCGNSVGFSRVMRGYAKPTIIRPNNIVLKYARAYSMKASSLYTGPLAAIAPHSSSEYACPHPCGMAARIERALRSPYSVSAQPAKLASDRGARVNPGPAAYGYVLEAEDGTVLAATARGSAWHEQRRGVPRARRRTREGSRARHQRGRGRLGLDALREADARRVQGEERAPPGAERRRGRARTPPWQGSPIRPSGASTTNSPTGS
jgi:hypothetical protein